MNTTTQEKTVKKPAFPKEVSVAPKKSKPTKVVNLAEVGERKVPKTEIETLDKKCPSMNDLAEALFNTPKGFEFVRYGKRVDADVKISKNPQGLHLIEINRKGVYSAQELPKEKMGRYLSSLCSKFKKQKLLEEAKKEDADERKGVEDA